MVCSLWRWARRADPPSGIEDTLLQPACQLFHSRGLFATIQVSFTERIRVCWRSQVGAAKAMNREIRDGFGRSPLSQLNNRAKLIAAAEAIS